MKRWATCIALAGLGTIAVAAAGGRDVSSDAPGQQARGERAATQPATTRPAGERPLYAGHAPDEWSSYQAMHAYFVERFVAGRGFGLERIVDVRDPRFHRVYADGTRYTVGGVQLVSLDGGKTPFAYVTGMDADMQRIAHATHEPLGSAETDALAKLQDGMTVVLTGDAGHREMVGAIRATADCASCHHVPEGTLLGAFRYPLRPELPLQRVRPAGGAMH